MPTLNWIGKDAVINHHLDVPYRTLEKQYEFNGDSRHQSENKIIHGDNLEALKALLPEYEGRVKCIYIDPPYNTGNENWVYNDNVNSPKIKKWLGQVVGKESEDLTRHDKWLCMMYPRLKLLHKLLSQDGAIFISIDDNEQANLKLICDEIFGAGNFVGMIANINNPKGRSDDKFIATAHEYIYSYVKDKRLTTWYGFEPTEEIICRYNKIDELGNKYREIDLRKTGENDLREDRPNLFYFFYFNEITKEFFPSKDDIENNNYKKIVPLRADGKEGNWRWSLETAKEKISSLIPKFMPSKKIWGVMEKDYLASRTYVKPTSSWTYKDVNSERGTEALLNIGFQKKDFQKPKPIGTINRILQIATDKDSIILDSFAGSGTTAHAVLNLNKQDGGNRKFILVEMEDYAETITAERVRRVIKGYGEGKNKVEGTGGNFEYFELGEPLLVDGFINENQPLENIRSYIFYTETKLPLQNVSPNNEQNSSEIHPHFLGTVDGTSYYLYYSKTETTTLDFEFLGTIKNKAERYVIYADNCLLTKEFMFKHNINFKKIPRDVRRF